MKDVFKKSAAWLYNIILAALVTALVSVAIYVSLGRYLVEYIDDYQDEILQQIKDYSGLPLQVARITGRWDKLSPFITLEQVALAAPDSAEVVASFETLSVQVAPIRSLLEGALRFNHLSFHGADASFQEIEPGKWQLQSYPVEQKGNSDFDSIIDLLLAVNLADFSEAKIQLDFFSNETARIHLTELSLQQSNDFRRIRLQARLEETAEPIEGLFEAKGDPRDSKNFSAKAYLKLRNSDFSRHLPVIEPFGIKLNQAVINAELWLDWRPGTDITAQGYMRVPHLDLAALSGEPLEPLHDMALQFRAEKNLADSWQLWVPELSMSWQGEQLSFEKMQFKLANEHIQWAIPQLSVDQLKQHLLEVSLLAEQERTLIETLSPSGELENLHVSYALSAPEQTRPVDSKSLSKEKKSREKNSKKNKSTTADPLNAADTSSSDEPNLDASDRAESAQPRFSIRANLRDGAIQPWYGAPGARGVKGYIEAQPLSGLVEIDTDSLALDFPKVYEHQLEFESALAQVTWQISEKNVRVNSGPIFMRGEYGPASGLLALDLPLRKDEGTPTMELSIGLRDMDVAYRELFLPYILDEGLLDWLAESVGAGRVREGGFIYRGSLLANDEANRSVQLFFDVGDVALDFHSDWPGLSNIDGQVFIDNRSVDVFTNSAKMFDLDVSAARVSAAPSDKGMWLTVEAQAAGPASDALKVINNSLINDLVNDGFQNWRLEGIVQTTLSLGVPLAKNSASPAIDVAVNVQASELYIPEPDLTLTKLNGLIRYTSSEGLSSKRIAAELFNKPINLDIHQQKNGAVDVDVLGTVAMQDVARWSKQPAVYFAEGETAFSANIHIAASAREDTSKNEAQENTPQDGDQIASNETNKTVNHPEMPEAKPSQFSLTSDLQGVSFNFPKPYNKNPGDSWLLEIVQPLDAGEKQLRISLPGRADLELRYQNTQAESGLLVLGQGATAEHFPGMFTVTGQLPEFELGSWQHVLDQYLERQHLINEELAAVSGSGEVAASALQVAISRLRVTDAQVLSQQISHGTVDGLQRDDGWWLSLISPNIDGELFIPAFDAPMSVRIDKLKLAALQAQTLNQPEGEVLQTDVSPALDQQTVEPTVVTSGEAETSLQQADSVPGSAAESPVPPETFTAEQESSALDLQSLEDFSAYIAIANLLVGEDNLGYLHFRLSTKPGELMLDDLGGDVRGIRLGVEKPVKLSWKQQADNSLSAISGDFDFSNIGKVLEAWNYERFVESKAGQGALDLSWPGSPMDWQLVNSTGSLAIQLKEGQFLKASETASGTLKVVGIVNLMNLVRRLRLDFSDLFQKGISFDSLEGNVTVKDKRLKLADELVVYSPSSRFHLRGEADLESALLDMELIATLPIANNLPWLVALAGGLPTAAGVYVASKLFEKEVDRLSSAVYTVKGDWNDPELKFKRVFDNTELKKTASKEAISKENISKKSSSTTGDNAKKDLPVVESGEETTEGGGSELVPEALEGIELESTELEGSDLERSDLGSSNSEGISQENTSPENTTQKNTPLKNTEQKNHQPLEETQE